MNASPPSTSRHSLKPAPSATRSVHDPARQRGERQGLKDRFAAKLEREEAGKLGQSRDTAASSGAEGLPSGSRLLQERESGDGSQSGFANREMQVQLAGQRGVAGTGPSGPVPLDTAQLQRMAAQIAEGAPLTAASEASIQFPDGSLAEAAHIKREPDGSIAIRIAGLDPRLTALQNGRAQIELMNGLALRRLRVSSLTLERAKPNQRGRDPAMSRVV